MKDLPIIIVGAGPGGTMCALFLAKAGIPSILIDKAVFPRDKICGDAFSGKVFEFLRKYDENFADSLHSEDAQVGSWGVSFHSPNLKRLDVPFTLNYDKSKQFAPGILAKRIDFDNLMIEKCKANPLIDVREGIEITDIVTDNEKVTISMKDKPDLIGKIVVGADGAHSIVNKKLGKIKLEPEHYCAGIRAYYKGVTDTHPDHFIELHFLKEFLPGYFWIFPLKNGFANVGVGMRSDYVSKKKVNLKKAMQDIIENHPQFKGRFENATLEDKYQGFGLPLGSKKREISGNRFLLVGDAASLIDPFTGEGIGNAVLSGMYAANQIQKSILVNDFSEKELKNYDIAIYNRVWAELKVSYTVQKMVNYPWLFNFIVNKANKNQTLKESITCMFEDVNMKAKLRSPLFYLKLLFNF